MLPREKDSSKDLSPTNSFAGACGRPSFVPATVEELNSIHRGVVLGLRWALDVEKRKVEVLEKEIVRARQGRAKAPIEKSDEAKKMVLSQEDILLAGSILDGCHVP